MKIESSTRVFLKDFHGLSVWVGVAMGLVGFLALEWPIHNSGIGAMMFLGGQQLGMGLMRNRQMRETEQPKQEDGPPAEG